MYPEFWISYCFH